MMKKHTSDPDVRTFSGRSKFMTHNSVINCDPVDPVVPDPSNPVKEG